MLRMKYNRFLQVKKLDIFWLKMAYFFLSAQDVSICIKICQNVCRMNCANVLYTKLSKKWFSLHLMRVKLMNYMLHFVVNDPVRKSHTQTTLTSKGKGGQSYFIVAIMLCRHKILLKGTSTNYLGWQNFEDFWPPPIRWQVYKISLCSIVGIWVTPPSPLIVIVIYGCPVM